MGYSMSSKIQRHKGFTILETIVAIGLISGVLAIFVNAVYLSIRSLDNAERKYIAAKIAQEGMELFVSKRNNNVLCLQNEDTCGVTLSDWQEDLWDANSCNNGPQGFEIYSNESEKLLPGETLDNYSNGHLLCYNATRDQFVQENGSSCSAGTRIEGNPTRRIRTCSQNSERLLAQSIVEWEDRDGAIRTTMFEKVLFETQP